MRMQNRAGFTLIEVLLAVAVTGMVMVAVSGSFISTLRAREEVQTLSDSTQAGERILTLLERDLHGLWHHNIKNNAVLKGRNMDYGGFDADRIDFLTSTDAISGVLDSSGQLTKPSICEVGYWLKDNPRIPGLLELWRREDPLVDADLVTDGQFQMVSDRLKSFNITYYETLGYKSEELMEWDSSLEDQLPRRIKIEFTVHRQVANRNQSSGEVADFEKILKTYTRHIVFDPRMTEILMPGIAMVSLAPPRPEAGGGGGPAGPGGEEGLGPAGPAGPGGVRTTEGGDNTSLIGAGNRGRASTQTRGVGRGGGGGGRGGPTITQGGGASSGFDLGNLLRGAGIPPPPSGGSSRK